MPCLLCGVQSSGPSATVWAWSRCLAVRAGSTDPHLTHLPAWPPSRHAQAQSQGCPNAFVSPGSRLLLLLRTFSPLPQLLPTQAWSLVPTGPSGSLSPASSLHDTQPPHCTTPSPPSPGSGARLKERPLVLTLGGHLCCLNEGGQVFPTAVGPTGRVSWSGIRQAPQDPFLGS